MKNKGGWTQIKIIFICHIHNYIGWVKCREYISLLVHSKWTHTWSSGQPCYSARGAVGGSVPCSSTPQSWYWRRILPPPTIPVGPEIQTLNLPLTSPTRYPLGHDCPKLYVLLCTYTLLYNNDNNSLRAWREGEFSIKLIWKWYMPSTDYINAYK